MDENRHERRSENGAVRLYPVESDKIIVRRSTRVKQSSKWFIDFQVGSIYLDIVKALVV